MEEKELGTVFIFYYYGVSRCSIQAEPPPLAAVLDTVNRIKDSLPVWEIREHWPVCCLLIELGCVWGHFVRYGF